MASTLAPASSKPAHSSRVVQNLPWQTGEKANGKNTIITGRPRKLRRLTG